MTRNIKTDYSRRAGLAASAQAAPAAVAGPVAVLKFERGTPGRENEMPRVVSCNWMPDGEYEVYLAAAPTTQPAPQQETQEPVAGQCRFPGAVWSECSPEHVRMVLANPEEWKRYEVRYLYTAEVLAVPLTDEQIRAMLNKHPPEDVCGWSYRMGIDDAELHHGIKGGQHDF